jgi:hypothetical protein
LQTFDQTNTPQYNTDAYATIPMSYPHLILVLVLALCLSAVHCVTVLYYDGLSTDPSNPTALPYNERVQITVPIHAEPVYLKRSMFMYSTNLLVVDVRRSNTSTRALPFAQVSVRPKYVPSDVYAGTSMLMYYGGAAHSHDFPAITCEWLFKINTTKLIEAASSAASSDTSTIEINFSLVTKDEGIEQDLCGKAKTDAQILEEQAAEPSAVDSSLAVGSSNHTETSSASLNSASMVLVAAAVLFLLFV